MSLRIFDPRSPCLALLFCAGLGACQSPTDVDRQLDIAISVDSASLAPGTSTDVSITIRNRGPATVQTLNPLSYACGAPYQVLDSAGQVVPLPDRICTAVAYSPVNLAPGASLTVHDRWSAVRNDGSGGSTTVASGQYQIVARIFGDGREILGESTLVMVR